MAKIIKIIIVFTIVISPFLINPIYANSTVSIKKDASYPQQLKLEILEDKEKKLTINDIISPVIANKFKVSKDKSPGFGFTDSAIWVKFTIQSEKENTENLILELDYPLMDLIELYIPKKNGKYTVKKTGYSFPFSNREIKHRNFLFNINIPGNQKKTYYIKFKNEDRMEIPLNLWSSTSFQQKDHLDQFSLGIYYGIVLIITIYIFLLFFIIKDVSHLYYGFFIITYGFFQLTQNGLAYEYFWPEILSGFSHYIPYIDLILFFCLIQFTQSFLKTKENQKKIHIALSILKYICLVSMLFPFIIGYSNTIKVIVGIAIVMLIMVMTTGTISLINNYRPAKYFMIAWSMFLVGGIVYALKIIAVLPNNVITSYSIQVGSVIGLFLFSFGLGDRIRLLKDEKNSAQKEVLQIQEREVENLQRANDEIEEVNKLISLSEERYKLLVEGSNDIVFSLDEEFNFLTANRALKVHLKINPDSVKSMNFLDIIYEDAAEGDSNESVAKKFVQEKLEQFLEEKKPIEFTTDLYSASMLDPKEMKVRLEYINTEGKNEIIGKASSIVEDSLLKFFKSEKQNYIIDNNLITAEDVTHRLTKNLTKYIDSKQINMVRIALREIIINAIEHGNLNITFEEKSKALEEDNYFRFISKRQRDPRFSERRVDIEYLINKSRVAYKVTDEGFGFNHSEIFKDRSLELNENLVFHGRGIRIALNVFDQIQYNKKGNQVLLIKNFVSSK